MTAAVLLRPAQLDSPATATRVEPGDFEATARAFADGQSALNEIMVSLREQLGPHSPCIGADGSARYLADRYRAAGEQVMSGLASLGTVLGAIARGLAQSGTDHSRADAISAKPLWICLPRRRTSATNGSWLPGTVTIG